MTTRYLYAVPDPAVGLVQVFQENRSRGHRSVYQLVSKGGKVLRMRLVYGVPRSVRDLTAPGGPPPLKFESRGGLRETGTEKAPSAPCLHCGRRAMPVGVRNAFWAFDYSPGGFVCPVCGGFLIIL